jgi:hypothetical protein
VTGFPVPHDPQVVAEAARLVEGGMTGDEVAGWLADRGITVDPTSVARWARAAGVSRRRGPRGRDDIDEWLIVVYYLLGTGPTETARRMGLPVTTVRNRLALMLGKPRPGRREVPQYRQQAQDG